MLASGIRPALLRSHTLPWRQSLPRSTLHDMHRDHPYCSPPAPAFCSCTTANATCPATPKRLPTRFVCPCLRSYPQDQAPAHPSYANGRSSPRHRLLIRHQHLQSSLLDVPSTCGSGSPPRTPRASPPTRPAIFSAVPTICLRTNREHESRAMRVTYPCAATLRPTSSSNPDPVAQCGYGAHHHQRIAALLHNPRPFPPVPVRAHRLPRRSAVSARLPRLHVLLRSPATPACAAGFTDIPHHPGPRCTRRV
ncbi:hypothetical protein K438DRAFT_800716 [Mycena galopus ATCC 62051]|nr:hypothetical protein K438DRAFT_800716 [Mycena galopus ATCC 62051]